MMALAAQTLSSYHHCGAEFAPRWATPTLDVGDGAAFVERIPRNTKKGPLEDKARRPFQRLLCCEQKQVDDT